MPKDDCDKLKLVHLVWMIVAVVATVCLACGSQKKQLEVNTANIETKVNKEVFGLHLEQQTESNRQVQEKLDTIIEKL